MKKMIAAALCLLLCSSMLACTSEDAPQETQGKEIEYQSGYLFSYKGEDISVGDEAAPVLQILGEASNKIVQTGCANFDGMKETVYFYSSFQVIAHEMNGKEIITTIYLEDDSITTKEGICIGDSAEKVLSTYGTKDSASAENNLIFTKGDMTLQFIIEDSSVTAITYLLTVA